MVGDRFLVDVPEDAVDAGDGKQIIDACTRLACFLYAFGTYG